MPVPALTTWLAFLEYHRDPMAEVAGMLLSIISASMIQTMRL